MESGSGHLEQIVRVDRNKTRKAKTYLELNLAKDSKYTKKCSFKCMGNQRQTRDNVGSLESEEKILVREEAEEAD